MAEFSQSKNRYIDFNVLENVKYLKEKRIVIYGAGNYGKQAAEMLQQLGFKYEFCDKDTNKQGMSLMGGKVFSPIEIEKWENLCIIIAIEREDLKKEIEQALQCIASATFLSFFALSLVWKYLMKHNLEIESQTEAMSSWYQELSSRGNIIRKACKSPILVYQSGKVGSITVVQSLQAMNIESAHIHRFFFKNDMVGELLLGKEQGEFIKESNFFQFHSSEYVSYIKNENRGKKIITLVREPIAVDLSAVFQWIGRGVADRYFAKQLKQGKDFTQIVSELMVRIQNRLFDWFDEELRELSGIDVFAHPFDKEKGYTIIAENGMEILLIKTEKLSEMTQVIRDFTGSQQLELVNGNIGKNKGYAYIYEEVKKNLKLPEEYVKRYYNNNLCMDHFYSEEEKKKFLEKWMRCIR